jgi:hypothetical protein
MIGYDSLKFAPLADKFIIDIDDSELNKLKLSKKNYKWNIDLRDFFILCDNIQVSNIQDWQNHILKTRESESLVMNKHRALCGCQKCGDKRFWLIDYHHIDPKEKDHHITYYKMCKLEILKNEIKKCIPLCRNCHTDFHYQEKQTGITINEYLNLNHER